MFVVSNEMAQHGTAWNYPLCLLHDDVLRTYEYLVYLRRSSWLVTNRACATVGARS